MNILFLPEISTDGSGLFDDELIVAGACIRINCGVRLISVLNKFHKLDMKTR